jgi:hypothetical protein
VPSQAEKDCFVLALPRYPVDPAWPQVDGRAWREEPDGADLAVLAVPDETAGMRDAFAAARVPGIHDPSQDMTCYRVPATLCDALVGPVGTRRPATPPLLSALEPYAFTPAWPDLASRAEAILDHRADLDLLEGMLDLRKAMVLAAVERQSTRKRLDAYHAQIGPQMDTLQGRILAAWRRPIQPGPADAIGQIRADQRRAILAAIEGDPGPILAVDIDAPDAVRRLEPGEPDYAETLERLAGGSPGLLAPLDRGVLDTRLDEALAHLVEDVRRGHAQARTDHDRLTALGTWIARNIGHVVDAAAAQIAGRPERPILAQLRAIRLHYRIPANRCEVLGHAEPEGDELAYLALIEDARPAEAVLGLHDPRQWLQLLDHLALLPAHRLMPQRVLAPGSAKMTFSGATDIRLTRRPGLVGRTRFEALCLGEQHTLTVPATPDEPNPFAALRPGQLLRVTASAPGGARNPLPEDVVYDELDAMVIDPPKTISAGRITERTLARLAHREGMRPEAYRALINGKGAGVVIKLKVVATRAITREIDLERERARQITRQRQREIQRMIQPDRAPGRSR